MNLEDSEWIHGLEIERTRAIDNLVRIEGELREARSKLKVMCPTHLRQKQFAFTRWVCEQCEPDFWRGMS